MESFAVEREATGDRAGAVLWRRQVAAQDQLNSDAALHLMRALAAAGDPGAAIRHARVHETLLREELDAPPDARIGQFVKTLQESPATIVTTAPPPASSPASERSAPVPTGPPPGSPISSRSEKASEP